jgi:putative transposase
VDALPAKRLYVMAFLERGIRRLRITGVTPLHPGLGEAPGPAIPPTNPTRAGSPCVSCRATATPRTDQSVDAVFEAEDSHVLLSAPRAPGMTAHRERVIGAVRREALGHLLLMNEAHARHVLAGFERHDNGHRPHRARDQQPPHACGQPATVHDSDGRGLLRTRILGGAINDYRYAA